MKLKTDVRQTTITSQEPHDLVCKAPNGQWMSPIKASYSTENDC